MGMLIFLGVVGDDVRRAVLRVRLRALAQPDVATLGSGAAPGALGGGQHRPAPRSSLGLQLALRAVRRARLGSMRRALVAALLLGVGFLVGQVLLFLRMLDAGIRWDAGAFGGAVYGLCGFHALHAAVGLGGLAAVLLAALGGAIRPGRHLKLRLWTQYWHFVGAVWLILFPAIFAGWGGG